MSAMDDAMAKLATSVEAAKVKAVDDYKAANPPADPQAAADSQEAADAEKVSAFADQIAPAA